ncbi:MAG: bifunctional precorrin-2 dehydrogenase/sirohydrochlorin ferrochelatase [Ignavibacteriaceae bacterium]|nr:bifunctional precorrin-2 dehydrogenase/sirohydrochlorin ferrochelatase [Ignavibacteriaceae bacterium]
MKKRRKSMFFPVLINLNSLPCLVIGGGNVAYRKATTLLNFKAKVTVVSPKINESLKDLAKKNKIKIIKDSYKKNHLQNFEVIFCATDNSKTNLRVHEDCKAKKKLLNVADVPELCDFILPAIVKRGDLTLSVSSQGKAPFYAADIKNRLNHVFPDYYKDIIDIAGGYRSSVLSDKKFNNSKLKQNAFNKFFEVNWKKVLEQNGKSKTKEYLKKFIKEI